MNKRQRKKRAIKTLQRNYKTTSKRYYYSNIDESYVFLKGEAKKKALINQYRALAEKADRRLRRIRTYANSGDRKYQHIEKFAYAKLMKDIQDWYGEGAKGSQKSANWLSDNLTTKQIEARMNKINEFLNMPTSTISGINRVWDNRTNTIENKYGIKMSDAVGVFERGIFDRYVSEQLSSSMILKIIGKQKANKKDFDKFLSEQTGKDIKSKRDADDLIKYITNNLKTKDNKSGAISKEDLLNYVNS